MSYEQVPLQDFKKCLSVYTELSSVALGGVVTSVSDEFFAAAYNLLKVEPAPSLKGQFGPNGALYSGWESRRHNPAYDWCIIKLGAPGQIQGFDIDTSNFNGNEAPEVSVQASFVEGDEDPTAFYYGWQEILPKVSLGPSSRHLFKIPLTKMTYNYVKLNMYPDGGIARFRVYGLVKAILPVGYPELLDLAHVFNGGRVVFTSDEHFGVGSNLVLPGRGKDMGDGWETKRSRAVGHLDWAVIKLGVSGFLEYVEIDTNDFKGNFPESCEILATNSVEDVPTTADWIRILRQSKLGPHRRHFFHLENVASNTFTHVKLIIYPDGGIKRVRIMGRCVEDVSHNGSNGVKISPPAIKKDLLQTNLTQCRQGQRIPVLPLTPETFGPFGQVIMAWPDKNSVPRGTKVTMANQGTAHKFHNLSLVESSYPKEKNARTGFSVYRSTPCGARPGSEWEVRLLERHPCTNQAFIPMGSASALTDEELADQARAYLVVVALSGEDDKPDLQTIRAFFASTSQGIVYSTGVWHHPMVALEKAIDFTCVETQVGGDPLDCEILQLDSFPVLILPNL